MELVQVCETHEVQEERHDSGMKQARIPVVTKRAVVGHYLDLIPESLEDFEAYRVEAESRLGAEEFFNAVISGCRVKYAGRVRNPQKEITPEKAMKAAETLDREQLERLLARFED